MTINIQLSEQGIKSAISALQTAKSNIENGLTQTIDILAKDGANEAQTADGGMAVVTGTLMGSNTAIIQAAGEAPVIAEFGAGDATMIGILFDNPPGVDVYPGSYSEQVGSGEYYRTRMASGGTGGHWHFGGIKYTEVKPKQGMLKAKQYIIRESTNIAKGVIKL